MKPQISYVICAVQRSGSFLLCEALKNTGLAGFPEEYFLPGEGWEDGWWARQHGVTSRADYLNLVFEQGTSSNGVFGTKIMWNYFPTMLNSLQELPEYKGLDAPQLMASLFPNVRYIWIVRRDKVRQAVSWAKAGQTDIYALHKGGTPNPKQEPTFDFGFIDQLHHLILEGETGWQSFFEACGTRPFKVEYEELVEAYEPTALRILDYLNVSYPKNLVFGERRLQKQADALNEAWVRKYIEMKQADEFA
ncbi:MAG TPA: Stf0 family sulfotransferase [Anaerolineales bacterium]|nr:Stf0 family sulfotransferase [Anaerolineales bacterium]